MSSFEFLPTNNMFNLENLHNTTCFLCIIMNPCINTCLLSFYTSEEICKCGYSKEAHNVKAIKPEDFVGETWNKHRHVLEVPTNAFGEIQFDGLQQTTAKYARVSSETSPEVLYRLLTEQWHLLPPNLLISVTGGAKNFNLKPHLRNMFHRGLIKVAQTTGAWIITGGTNAGVMKHVGQAVRDYSLSNSMQGQIVAIGVATWGVIHNRDALINEEVRLSLQVKLCRFLVFLAR
uniref:Transient receptor potential cation channel, subfamily M, member 2 n=1 Tax=Oryzias latipes TaxID=8090 RepID=A0A3P9H160_ORYLA